MRAQRIRNQLSVRPGSSMDAILLLVSNHWHYPESHVAAAIRHLADALDATQDEFARDGQPGSERASDD